MLQTLDDVCSLKHQALEKKLKKANSPSFSEQNLYLRHYSLNDTVINSTHWMLAADGITPSANEIWFRADPVILEATHNGIVCRGNAILHLDKTECDEIEAVLNNHFKADGLSFQFHSPSHGYLVYKKDTEVTLTPLEEVLGQDISNKLPSGNDGRYWQQVLMEIQMLLHRTECNESRRETAEKTVDGLWLWGNQQPSEMPVNTISAEEFYTNNRILQQIYREQLKSTDIPDVSQLLSSTKSIEILFSQLEEACVQNDTITWQSQWQALMNNYIEPLVEATLSGKISSLEIITEQSAYELKPWHRWRFWA